MKEGKVWKRKNIKKSLILLQEGHLRGLIIRRFPLGLASIDFLFLQIGKSSFQVLFRKGFQDCVLIIFLFFLIVVVFIGVLDRSSSRICG
jgi:hypothetical protein